MLYRHRRSLRLVWADTNLRQHCCVRCAAFDWLPRVPGDRFSCQGEPCVHKLRHDAAATTATVCGRFIQARRSRFTLRPVRGSECNIPCTDTGGVSSFQLGGGRQATEQDASYASMKATSCTRILDSAESASSHSWWTRSARSASFRWSRRSRSRNRSQGPSSSSNRSPNWSRSPSRSGYGDRRRHQHLSWRNYHHRREPITTRLQPRTTYPPQPYLLRRAPQPPSSPRAFFCCVKELRFAPLMVSNRRFI